MTQNQKKLLGQVFLYAYAKKPADLYSYSEYLPQYIATQLLVWEVIAGQRDAQFNRISNGYTPVKDVLNNFKSLKYANRSRVFTKPMKKISRLTVKRSRLGILKKKKPKITFSSAAAMEHTHSLTKTVS